MTSAVESFEPAGGSFLFDDRVFAGFFLLVGVLMVTFVTLFVWVFLRNVRAVRRHGAATVGHRPASVHRSGGGRLPAPSVHGSSLAARLQELDDLHRRGVITDTEHATARHQALTSS